jgi:uncharacterized protein YijF (DUF1287 family)
MPAKFLSLFIILGLLGVLLIALGEAQSPQPISPSIAPPLTQTAQLTPHQRALQEAARAEVGVTVTYDPSYVRIPYPNGDLPMDRGVCTDVVIRALRKVGIDLQKCVHEDMKANPSAYAKLWGQHPPDPSIDHRRVPNLMCYYRRQGWQEPITADAKDYRGGDIVVWRLPSGALHTGLVYARDDGSLLVVHNIGEGAQCEDCLFAWKLIGHYRVPERAMR